ncbi:hypothetical protein [Sphingomonas oryzagri]
MRTPSRTRAFTALALLPFLALAACNSKPTVIQAQDDSDDMKTAVANAAPVELPPSIAATKTFRCKDNSVITLDFYSDGKSVGVHPKPNTRATVAKADAAGQPMKTADGAYTVSGTATAASVDITMPGKDKQACDSE